jgi:hypothetical protein
LTTPILGSRFTPKVKPMGKHLSFSLVLVLVLISILTGCTTSTITQTVTQHQTKTITQTITETKNPPITFSSRGNRTTTTFDLNSSSCILQYSTKYTGRLTIALQPYVNLLLVNDEEVVKGVVYQREMEGYTYSGLYFAVSTYPYWGEWTISVIEITD